MIDAMLVSIVVLGAAVFVGYRFFGKKSGGCSCGGGSGGCRGQGGSSCRCGGE